MKPSAMAVFFGRAPRFWQKKPERVVFSVPAFLKKTRKMSFLKRASRQPLTQNSCQLAISYFKLNQNHYIYIYEYKVI